MAAARLKLSHVMFFIILGLILLGVWMSARQSSTYESHRQEYRQASEQARMANDNRMAAIQNELAYQDGDANVAGITSQDSAGNDYTALLPQIRSSDGFSSNINMPEQQMLKDWGLTGIVWQTHAMGAAGDGKPRVVQDKVLIYVSGTTPQGQVVVDYVDLVGQGEMSYSAMAQEFAAQVAQLQGDSNLGQLDPDMEYQLSGMIYRFNSPVPHDIFSLQCRERKCMFQLQMGDIPLDYPDSGTQLISDIIHNAADALGKQCGITFRADTGQNVYFSLKCLG